MAEFIVRETGYPGATKQEVVGELIRCKDCKYSVLYLGESGTVLYYRCMESCLYGRMANDFCSYAVRREEEE